MTKKTTTIGLSNLHVNDVGNPQLHQRNKVKITRIGTSSVGRAVVIDQHIIDVLLFDKKISPESHQVLEKYLEMIAVATGSSSIDLAKANIDQSYKAVIPKSVILIKVQKRLRKDLGFNGEKEFWNIMVDHPQKISEYKIDLVLKASESLSSYWYSYTKNPVSSLQSAILDQ
jgi:hypothetical protein|tara:strand:- start:480 stop:995 length:516 start_codon:yes stop_codon:yes gene_type:complete